jgi:hypothetical protein
VREGQKRVEEQYGEASLLQDVASDWDSGLLAGKVSAIRWVLGDEWDMLDS